MMHGKGHQTIVLDGIAMNFGVGSTARAAFDCRYTPVFAENALSSHDERHAHLRHGDTLFHHGEDKVDEKFWPHSNAQNRSGDSYPDRRFCDSKH